MSPSTKAVSAVEPGRMAPPLHVFSTRFARRMFFDRVARWVVTLGGVIIIGTILAILLVIVGEVYPLLRPATAHPRAPVDTSLDGRALAIETDEYRATAAVVTQTGVHFVSLTCAPMVGNAELPQIGAAKVTAVSAAGGRSLALGLSDGRVLPTEIAFHDRGGGAVRRVDGDVQALEPLPIDPSGRAIEVLAHAAREDGSVTA